MKNLIYLFCLGLFSCNTPDVCYFRTTEAASTIKIEATDFDPNLGIVTKTKNDSITKTILIYPLPCEYRVNDVVLIEGDKRVLIEKL